VAVGNSHPWVLRASEIPADEVDGAARTLDPGAEALVVALRAAPGPDAADSAHRRFHLEPSHLAIRRRLARTGRIDCSIGRDARLS
jgi:hypothetical protein